MKNKLIKVLRAVPITACRNYEEYIEALADKLIAEVFVIFNTEHEIIKELRNMADIMKCLGDVRKTKILTEAVALIERLIAERDQALVKANLPEICNLEA